MTAKPGIIYLQKDKFQLFSPFLRQIVEFRFVPEIVRDSDIINKELLESLVKVFVENTKIPPGNLTIVLADNTYFVKDFLLPTPPPVKPGQPAPPQPQMTMETISVMSMDFVEHVPYENVVSLTFPLKNGLKVCAVNKDFYDTVSSSFEKLGFVIDAVYPGLVFGGNLTTKPVLDAQLVNTVFQKAGSIKQYDLLQQKVFSPDIKKDKDAESVDDPGPEVPQDPKKTDKKRLFLMVGLLAVLLIILAIVAVQSMAPVPPPKHAATVQSNPLPADIVSLAPTEVTAAPPVEVTIAPAKLQTQSLSLEIVSSTNDDPNSKTLHDALSKYTFKNLTVQTQSTTNSSSTLVTFSNNVTQDVKNAVLAEVRNVKSDVVVQEKQSSDYDITVLLAK
jgi:hypothetical protein